ncbi:MAG: EAL domain-containing protein [Rhodospirillaceae bacterium]
MTDKTCEGCQNGEAFPIPFSMAFQPIVDVAERRIYAYEALVRGPGGEGAGSVLEKITSENRYGFDQSCRVKAIQQAAALGLDRRLSINFLPNAVYEARACIRATLTAADQFDFPLDQITFEITEDERISDAPHLQSIITEYRRHGFSVALDDFGAGYAGLNSLVELDVDVVKLDMALVRGIDADQRRRTIAAGAIKVCEELGVKVVAEGVERAQEAKALRDIGVRFMQGFLFARPRLNALVEDADIPFT